jgi:hypothetical protein
MKYLVATALFLSGVVPAASQVHLPLASSIRHEFQKVVAEYPRQFSSIKGHVINENPQTIEYLSQLQLSGAELCFITRYSSGSKQVYSWQAVMFTSEDFEAADKKYQWLFKQLKGMNIFHVKDQYTLKGQFETASESRKFTTSTLSVASPPEPYEKLKVEVALQYEFPEWKVNLLVYEKEREDDERGEIVEE